MGTAAEQHQGELGGNDEISNFCRTNYGVSFPMFSKIHVRGEATHPLFKKLVEHPHYGGSVKWNFSKFLVDRNGELKNRFSPFTKPTSKRITKAIEKSLNFSLMMPMFIFSLLIIENLYAYL